MKGVSFALVACIHFLATPAVAQIAEPRASQVPLVQDNVSPAPAPTAQLAPPTGKIVVYRGSGVVGAAVGCPIRYKGQELVELGRGKFAEWAVPAGRYVLTNKTASVEVTVDAGEARFVRCMIKPGFMTGRADLQIVDHESFAEHQADYQQKEISYSLAK